MLAKRSNAVTLAAVDNTVVDDTAEETHSSKTFSNLYPMMRTVRCIDISRESCPRPEPEAPPIATMDLADNRNYHRQMEV